MYCTALWRYHCEHMMWVSGLARQEEKANFGTVHSSAPSLPRHAEVKAEEPEMCWATETLIFPGCFDNLQIHGDLQYIFSCNCWLWKQEAPDLTREVPIHPTNTWLPKFAQKSGRGLVLDGNLATNWWWWWRWRQAPWNLTFFDVFWIKWRVQFMNMLVWTEVWPFFPRHRCGIAACNIFRNHQAPTRNCATTATRKTKLQALPQSATFGCPVFDLKRRSGTCWVGTWLWFFELVHGCWVPWTSMVRYWRSAICGVCAMGTCERSWRFLLAANFGHGEPDATLGDMISAVYVYFLYYR